MSENLVQITRTEGQLTETSLMEVDLDKVPSPVLRRLIKEVRSPGYETSDSYSRFHNRHNRSGGGGGWPRGVEP